MNENRPAVPEIVKRQLRQEAGFGCVICGFPIYDYHHIIPYAIEEHMRAEDMILLCPNHHREAPLMSESEQRKYKTAPFNISKGFVNGRLRVSQQLLALVLGSVEFVNDGPIFSVDGEALLSMRVEENGQVLLSVRLFDRDDKLVVEIVDNVWITGDSSLWDLKFAHNRLEILKKSRDITFLLDCSSKYVHVKGTFYRKGVHIKITNNKIQGRRVSTSNLCWVTQMINIDTANPDAFQVVVNPAYGQGSWVSRATSEERLLEGLRIFEELKKAKPNI